MATVKVTITLPRTQLGEIQGLVASGTAASVSGFVQAAVDTALQDARGWREMLTESFAASGGPPTASERAWATAMLNRPRHAARTTTTARRRKTALAT